RPSRPVAGRELRHRPPRCLLLHLRQHFVLPGAHPLHAARARLLAAAVGNDGHAARYRICLASPDRAPSNAVPLLWSRDAACSSSAWRSSASRLPSGVFGIGQAMVMAPLYGLVLTKVPEAHAGSGGGVVSTMQQIGNGSGVAVV